MNTLIPLQLLDGDRLRLRAWQARRDATVVERWPVGAAFVDLKHLGEVRSFLEERRWRVAGYTTRDPATALPVFYMEPMNQLTGATFSRKLELWEMAPLVPDLREELTAAAQIPALTRALDVHADTLGSRTFQDGLMASIPHWQRELARGRTITYAGDLVLGALAVLEDLDRLSSGSPEA